MRLRRSTIMPSSTAFTPLALITALCLCSCLYGLASADVRISEPAPQGGYQRAAHRLAAFGPPIHHDQVISADIIPFEVHKPSRKHGCKPFDLGVLQRRHNEQTAARAPWIAVISRGQCTFEQKVRSAMQMGAVAAIVGNNEDSGLIIMSAQGDATDIRIPSVFIERKDYIGIIKRARIAKRHGRLLFGDISGEESPPSLPFREVLMFLMLAPVLVFCGSYLWLKYKQRVERNKTLASKKMVKKLPIRRYKIPRSSSPSSSIRAQADQPLLEESRAAAADVADDAQPLDVIESDCCAICLEDYEEGVMLRALRCRHEFHQTCIDPWLTTRKGVCPVCKTPIDPNYKEDADRAEEEPPASPTADVPGV